MAEPVKYTETRTTTRPCDCDELATLKPYELEVIRCMRKMEFKSMRRAQFQVLWDGNRVLVFDGVQVF